MSYHDWLHQQLPGWVRDGLITADAEVSLRERYPAERKENRAATIFSLLGGLLIAAGITALLAYKWDALNEPARLMVGILPILAAHGLVAWMMARGKLGSSMWREGVGAFYFVAVGAGIAILDGVFHWTGTDGRTLALVWTLMMLPCLYVLKSWFIGIMYLGNITWWTLMSSTWQEAVWYFLLVALVVPFGIMRFRAKDHHVSMGLNVSLWLLGLFFPLCLLYIMSLASGKLSFWALTATIIACIYVFASELWNGREPELQRRPLLLLGMPALIGIGFLYSFSGVWSWAPDHLDHLGALALPVWLGAIAIVLAVMLAVRKRWLVLAWLGLPVILLSIGIVVPVALELSRPAEFWGPVCMNLFILGIAILHLLHGIREREQSGHLHLGVFLLATLIVLRFFDSELDTLVKGIAFILTGTGFIALNVLIMRQKRGGNGLQAGTA